MSAPIRGGAPSNARRNAAIAAVLVLLAIGSLFGVRAFMNRNGNVVNAVGGIPNGGRLLDTGAKMNGQSPLIHQAQTAPAPLDPTDVNDYLKFLKEIERDRITLARRNTGAIMAMIPMLEGGNALAQMNENEADISHAQHNTYSAVQDKMNEVSGEWDALAKKFGSRQPPQACTQLATDYYDVLGKTSQAIVSVGNNFNQAMAGLNNGDMSKVGDIVERLKSVDGKGTGSLSKTVDDSCDTADKELAAVCDHYHLSKDFDIRPDGGGTSNPLGF